MCFGYSAAFVFATTLSAPTTHFTLGEPSQGAVHRTHSRRTPQHGQSLAGNGVIALDGSGDGGDFAAATPELMQHAAHYEALMHAALDLTKPTFNEDMRHGHTNM